MSDRMRLMEVAAKAGDFRKSPKNRPMPYPVSNHKYRVHGVREDLAKEYKAEQIEYYTPSIRGLELGFDTYADYWKRVYAGFYVVLIGGFMHTLYVDRVF